jgi:hypothetical protein
VTSVRNHPSAQLTWAKNSLASISTSKRRLLYTRRSSRARCYRCASGWRLSCKETTTRWTNWKSTTITCLVKNSEVGFPCTEGSEVTANGTSTISPVTKAVKKSHFKSSKDGQWLERRWEAWPGSTPYVKAQNTSISDVISKNSLIQFWYFSYCLFESLYLFQKILNTLMFFSIFRYLIKL